MPKQVEMGDDVLVRGEVVWVEDDPKRASSRPGKSQLRIPYKWLAGNGIRDEAKETENVVAGQLIGRRNDDGKLTQAAEIVKEYQEDKRQTGSKGRFGGAKRDRTADLLHAMQALSQLSYSPILGPARPVPGSPVELFVRSGGGFILLLSADGKPKNTSGQVFSKEPGAYVRVAC